MNLDDSAFGFLLLIMGVALMLTAVASKSKMTRVVGFVFGAFALWVGIYELFFAAVEA